MTEFCYYQTNTQLSQELKTGLGNSFAMPAKKPLLSQTIYGNANICIGVLLSRDRTTFGIILFRLPKSCRDKKSLLALCRPKSKIQEGKSEAASEASNKICCYQAGKCMNSKT